MLHKWNPNIEMHKEECLATHVLPRKEPLLDSSRMSVLLQVRSISLLLSAPQLLCKAFFNRAACFTLFHCPTYSSIYLEKLLYVSPAKPDLGFPVILNDSTLNVLTVGLDFFMEPPSAEDLKRIRYTDLKSNISTSGGHCRLSQHDLEAECKV